MRVRVDRHRDPNSERLSGATQVSPAHDIREASRLECTVEKDGVLCNVDCGNETSTKSPGL
jgi:hypothetical protein